MLLCTSRLVLGPRLRQGLIHLGAACITASNVSAVSSLVGVHQGGRANPGSTAGTVCASRLKVFACRRPAGRPLTPELACVGGRGNAIPPKNRPYSHHGPTLGASTQASSRLIPELTAVSCPF